MDTDTEVAHLLEKLLGAVDDGADDFARHKVLVAANGGAEQDVVDSTDAEQVVEVHDHGVDGDAFPHREVARLFPVEIGETRFGAGTVGVHDVAVVGVAAHDVGQYLAERLGEDAFVDVLDGVVDILFRCRHASQIVFQGIHGFVVIVYRRRLSSPLLRRGPRSLSRRGPRSLSRRGPRSPSRRPPLPSRRGRGASSV